ncbi:hypothetical protein [Mesorhizobium xinjiangense]|uniref:hypothetical protein n=1 Tax=Mesorhizobium xinjiangense TaxID=2678685 RepID=UPI0012ED3D4C|nr:hypothetical protein [Mesorhizobium xinjiangense]
MKHESNRMVIVEYCHIAARVDGYSICELDQDEALKPNRHIHSDSEAFSYNVDFRRIMANTYLIGESVAQEVRRLGRELQPKDTVKAVAQVETIDLLNRAARMSNFVFPGERKKHMPKFQFDGETLRLERSGGEAIGAISTAKSSARTTGDGYTKAC